MESTQQHLDALDASAALDDAEASRATLARSLKTPPGFFTSIGVAIAIQIGLTAVGLSWSVGDGGIDGVTPRTIAALAGGAAVLLVVAGVQLAAFRRLNGVWIDGLLSHVVLGTGALASGAYVVALFAAIWAAIAGQPWLVAVASIGGGAAYAIAGRRWLDAYRADPAGHTRGVSRAMVALAVVVAFAGVALLVVNR